VQPVRKERAIDQIRLDGGRPCLDFVNTIHDRHALPPEDYFSTPRRFMAWCERTELLEARETARIRVPVNLLSDVRELREGLFALFSARIDAIKAPPAAARQLDRWLHRAWEGLALDLESPHCLSWSPHAIDARLPLKRVALSAFDLLSRGDMNRLKRCESQDGCGWLFYDESKSNRRRWCAMETCGALAKTRRYRAGGAEAAG
jgi:predicted RNA-binding Zn ribbon-like protein